MLKNKIITIPTYNSPEFVCDYQLQTAKTLAKNNHVFILLLKPEISLKQILKNYVKNKKNNIFFKKNNIIFIKIRTCWLPFKRFKFIRKFNSSVNILILKLAHWLIRTKAKSKSQPILWIFYPYLYKITRRFKSYFMVYDIVDYHTSPDCKKNQRIRKNEKILIKKADFVCINSNSLYQKFKKIKKNVPVVPLGFRIDYFKKPLKKLKLKLKKPTLGFIGNISKRIDFNLCLKLIKGNPNWNLVFVGPKYRELSVKNKINKLNQLLKYKNFKWIKKQPKEKIPAIIKQFDICLIPYDTSEGFNKYSYPMKLFEYFYMGKPVVATPIEELRRFPKFVKISKNIKEWEKHIKSLLAKPWPEKYKKEQKKLAEQNSWQKKIEAISRTLEKYEKANN